jgi:myo-inositol-1-phosphate synthase
MSQQRLGVWLIGARGSIATTAIAGHRAVVDGIAGPTGLVTETWPFAGVPLIDLQDMVFGGHDVSDVPLSERARDLAVDRVLPATLPEQVAAELGEVGTHIRPGARSGAGPGTLARLRADLDTFREEHGLRHVVVVNVASTEPVPPASSIELAADELVRAATAASSDLPASLLYAVAALESRCAYVDFTPSPATRSRGVDELARAHGVPYAGRDGKTGETLLKAALAPMFADRALAVRSWAATNLLGGGDGRTLASPDAAASKLASKSGVVSAVLGDEVEAPVRIDYLADLGEWKTAWDLIAFDGFLGTRMRLQLTWDGCDSALAAPLVLDLARLAGLALERGESGPLGQLGYFFKDPVGTAEHRLAQQFEMLRAWAASSPARQSVSLP